MMEVGRNQGAGSLGNTGLQQGGQTTLGQALGSLQRPTPAEDLIAAIVRLNAAMAAAERDGWGVTLELGGVEPAFAGEGPIYQIVRAIITKAV